MRLALVQMTSEKAAIEANVSRMVRFLDQAADRGADVIVFPEMNVTGYIMPRKFPRAVIAWDHPALGPLYRWSQRNPAAIIVGIVEHNPHGRPFVSQAVIRHGSVGAAYRKIHIVDDEALVFSAGTEVLVHDHDGTGIGVLVCADQGRADLFARCADREALLVVLPSAPGLFPHSDTAIGAPDTTGGARPASMASECTPATSASGSHPLRRQVGPWTKTSRVAATSSTTTASWLPRPATGRRA